MIERPHLPHPMTGTGMSSADLAVGRNQDHAAIAVDRSEGPLDTAHKGATEEIIAQVDGFGLGRRLVC